MKAFGLAIMLGVVATSDPARALEVTGTSGFLGEWEVTATVTETASGRTRDYRGPLVLKHIGLCTQDGPVEKKGEMRLQISASSQLNATLVDAGHRMHGQRPNVGQLQRHHDLLGPAGHSASAAGEIAGLTYQRFRGTEASISGLHGSRRTA